MDKLLAVLDDKAALRKRLYQVQWVVNGVLAVLGIVLKSQGDLPNWYVTASLVLNFVWTYAGLQASRNVPEQ